MTQIQNRKPRILYKFTFNLKIRPKQLIRRWAKVTSARPGAIKRRSSQKFSININKFQRNKNHIRSDFEKSDEKRVKKKELVFNLKICFGIQKMAFDLETFLYFD